MIRNNLIPNPDPKKPPESHQTEKKPPESHQTEQIEGRRSER
jgi:hypothetical protein